MPPDVCDVEKNTASSVERFGRVEGLVWMQRLQSSIDPSDGREVHFQDGRALSPVQSLLDGMRYEVAAT